MLLLFIYSAEGQESFVTFFDKPDSVLAHELIDTYYDEFDNQYIALFVERKDSCQGFRLISLDEDGEILKEKSYCSKDSVDQLLAISNDISIQKLDDDTYYFRGGLVGHGFRSFDYWFDNELNSIRYTISDTISIDSIISHRTRRISRYKNTIIQVGSSQKPSLEVDPFIRCTDLDGHVLWQREYFAEDDFRNPTSSLAVYDTLLILGTTTNSISNDPTFLSQCHITFVHAADGTIVHELDLQLPESSNLGPTEVIPFERDEQTLLAFSSSESTYNQEWLEYRSQIRYFITDLDGNVVDSIRIGTDSSIFNGLIANNKTENGYISSGDLRVADRRSIVVGLFDEYADTLWWSAYDFNESQKYTERYDLSDQIVLPDGSIVLSGTLTEVIPPFFEIVKARPFILKLDPDGCLEPGCRVVSTVEEEPEQPIAVVPNPFHDSFTFLAPSEGVLTVHDIQGREILNTSLTKGAIEINLSDAPAGIFYYLLEHNGQIIRCGKLVKL